MNLYTRYKFLNFWNKYQFWAASVGFIIAIFALLSWLRSEVSDPLEIARVDYYVDSYLYEGRQPTQVSIEPLDPSGIPTTPFFSFSLTSEAEHYDIQIAPYLVIDVESVSPLPKQVFGVYQGERGDGGGVRYFQASLLSTDTGLITAPHKSADGTGAFPAYDYYRLRPGESEEFMLTLAYQPGFVYTFNVGVQYRYRHRDMIQWLPKTFRVGVPANRIPIFYFRKQSTELHPDFVPLDDVRQWRIRTDEFLARNTLFSLRQIRPGSEQIR